MNSELQGIKNILYFFPPQNKLMKFKIILKRPYHKLGCKHQKKMVKICQNLKDKKQNRKIPPQAQNSLA